MRRTLVTLLVVFTPLGALAQGASPPDGHSRIEIRVGGVWSPGTTGGTVQSDYAPPLVSGTSTGAASQTLTVDSTGSLGFEVGARVFVTPRVGLEIVGSRSSATLSGVNGPYRLSLDYESRQPPDYVPRWYQLTRDVDWADTEGDRTTTTLMAGAVVRWDEPGGAAGGTIAGGVSLRRLGGAIQSLAYTEFRLGGHSTLFYSQHRVEIEPDPGEWLYGPYLAADLHVRLAARTRLVGGVRVHLGSDPLRLSGRAARLVDPDEDTFPPDIQTVIVTMGSPAMTVPATRWQVFAGLAFVLK